MACNCAPGTGPICTCVLQSGDGVVIYGSGSSQDPYVIEANGNVGDAIQFVDSATVTWEVSGSGVGTDPFLVTADAGGNVDFDGGVTGNVLTKKSDGSWGPGPATQAPVGAVVSDEGLVGDGSGPNPLRVRIPTYAAARALQS